MVIRVKDESGNFVVLPLGSVSEEQISQAVKEFLMQNPVEVTETDPTVPKWAKQPNKPSYNVDEITNAVHKDDVGNVKELEIGGNTVEAINIVYEKIGDIDSALDELHNYAQALIAGGEN